MARRKRFGITSVPRYQLKAYRVHYVPGVPEDIVRSVASNQTASWTAGFGQFTRLWREKVVGVLKKMEVPTIQYGMYRAFTNEYLSKVIIKGTVDGRALIAKYVGMGLRADVLEAIVYELPEKKSENT